MRCGGSGARGRGGGRDEFIRIGNDGREWDARDKGTDTADFYSWIVDSRRLLLTKDELTWLERQTVPDREVDVFAQHELRDPS